MFLLVPSSKLNINPFLSFPFSLSWTISHGCRFAVEFWSSGWMDKVAAGAHGELMVLVLIDVMTRHKHCSESRSISIFYFLNHNSTLLRVWLERPLCACVCARGAELAGISFLENAVNRHGGATEHNGELIKKKKVPRSVSVWPERVEAANTNGLGENLA